jgi:CRISPR-associated protein (TIGR02710 family)
MGQPHILLCTVGTGDIDRESATLLEPLKKSIRKGEWTRVILLPSQHTAKSAAMLQQEIPDVPIVVNPLPHPGIEDDADACFAHFDQVLGELRSTGVSPAAILVDFTRGTKAMSAALVLAAMRHDLPQLRYISGKRDERGMVVPGAEIVAEVHTTVATARKRLDDAYRFFRHGNFAAVLDSLPDRATPTASVWPDDLFQLAALVRPLAIFAAAWDRLDYKRAATVSLPGADVNRAPWHAYQPPPDVQAWVAKLAEPLPDDNKGRAAPLRLLVADLLANGERRLRDHQYEDAVIRGYRVLELIGQIRLFERDLDSAALPPDHPQVKSFQEELVAEGKSASLTLKDGKFQASREQVARILKRLQDPLARRLLQLGNREEGKIKLSKRNISIWIHGFEAIAGSDPEPLRALFAELETLVILDGGPDARKHLELARWLDFTKA